MNNSRKNLACKNYKNYRKITLKKPVKNFIFPGIAHTYRKNVHK